MPLRVSPFFTRCRTQPFGSTRGAGSVSDVSYVGLLARLNRDRIAEASRLQEGLLLRLPPVEHVHLVAKKETLWSILKKRYGRSPDAALIKRIKDENGIADENRIKAGMLLYLPD